jgi:hypothetical protein
MNQDDQRRRKGPISGGVLMALRRRLQLDRVEFGRLVGLVGDDLDVHFLVWRIESGRAPSSEDIEERALQLLDKSDSNGER